MLVQLCFKIIILINIVSSILSGLSRDGVIILPGTSVGNFLISQWRDQQNQDSIHFFKWTNQWFLYYLCILRVMQSSCYCAIWGQTNEMFLRLNQVNDMNLFPRLFLKRYYMEFVDLPLVGLSFPVWFRRPTSGCNLSFCWGINMNHQRHEACTGDKSCGFMNVSSSPFIPGHCIDLLSLTYATK